MAKVIITLEDRENGDLEMQLHSQFQFVPSLADGAPLTATQMTDCLLVDLVQGVERNG